MSYRPDNQFRNGLLGRAAGTAPPLRRIEHFCDVRLRLRLVQKLQQFGKNGRDTPRLVARKQLTAAMSVTRLFFEIHVGKGLPVQIFHDKTGVQFLDGPGLRKVALGHSLLKHARDPSAPR